MGTMRVWTVLTADASAEKYDKVCVPQKINAHIALANIDEKQLEVVDELIKNITARQAINSNFSLSVLGGDYTHIGKFTSPVPPDTIRSKVAGIKNYGKERNISVEALSAFANFPYNEYRTSAEILILIVGNTTVFLGKPITFEKKKTFLIGIGGPVQKSFSEMATGEDHFFWFSSTEDLSIFSAAILDQICEDSKYPCDVDMYKPETSDGGQAKCKDCSLVCTKAELESGNCSACPDYPSKQNAENNSERSPAVNNTESSPAVNNSDSNKVTVIIAVIAVIIVAVGVLIVSSLIWFIRRRRYQLVPKKQDPHERSNTSRV